MTRRFLGIALAFLLIGPLFIASCSDDSSTNPGENPGDEIPDIPEAEIVETVDIQSEEPAAQQAEAIVEGMLGAAAAVTATSTAYTQPIDTATWSSSSGSCWTWNATYEGCTALYTVCDGGATYDWTLMFNGTCVSGADPSVNWIAMSGSTSTDGLSGTFQFYETNTTTVAGSWAWSMAANHKTGDWSFYDGTVDDTNLIAVLDWMENTDGSEDVVWLMPQTLKWTAHVGVGGTTGVLRSYLWSSLTQSWILNLEISWTLTGGHMTYYTTDGSVQSQETWGSES